MKRAVLIPLALALMHSIAASAAVDRGTIVPGRGIAGVELGMTRAAAVAALGSPSRVDRSELTWDLRRYPFCTPARICLGEAGGVAKLRARYGRRLEATRELGYPAYILTGKGYRGYVVYTVFVARPDPGPRGSVSRGRITNIALGYCAATPLC